MALIQNREFRMASSNTILTASPQNSQANSPQARAENLAVVLMVAGWVVGMRKTKHFLNRNQMERKGAAYCMMVQSLIKKKPGKHTHRTSADV